jgi:hypothetical protein
LTLSTVVFGLTLYSSRDLVYFFLWPVSRHYYACVNWFVKYYCFIARMAVTHCKFISPSVCHSVRRCARLSIRLSVCLSVCRLSMRLSISSFIRRVTNYMWDVNVSYPVDPSRFIFRLVPCLIVCPCLIPPIDDEPGPVSSTSRLSGLKLLG